MISVLLATTGRPDMAEQSVRNLHETTVGHDVEVVAAVDADEITANRLRMLVDVLHYSDDYRGCSKAWNDALSRATGDPVVLAADDLRWEHGWLEAALERLSEFPDGWGMVGFNDGHWGPDLSTHYMVSRRCVVEVFGGRIAWEHYTHSFNDVEACERAKRAGRYAWCESACVFHAHWLFGDRLQDDTDSRNLVDHHHSQQVYASRAAAGFPDELEPVIRS